MAITHDIPAETPPAPSGAVVPRPGRALLDIPSHGLITCDDVEGFADEIGHRFELLEGTLIVMAPPNAGHQIAQMELIRVLLSSVPSTHRVLAAPFDWRLSAHTKFEPDIVVIPKGVIPRRQNFVTDPPLLAIEILSPSTKYYDRGVKRPAYAEYGLTHFWIVDPEAPSLLALRRNAAGDEFDVVANFGPAEQVALAEPFPVEFAVADLLGE